MNSYSRQSNSFVSNSHSSSSISGGNMHSAAHSEPNFFTKKPSSNSTQNFANNHHGASLPTSLSYSGQHSSSYSTLKHTFKHQNFPQSRASRNFPNPNAAYNRRYHSNASLNLDGFPHDGESPTKSTSPSTASMHFLNNRKRRY